MQKLKRSALVDQKRLIQLNLLSGRVRPPDIQSVGLSVCSLVRRFVTGLLCEFAPLVRPPDVEYI